MGTRITVRCKNCSAKQDFLQGVGWEYNSSETLIDALILSKKEEVRRIFSEHEVMRRDSD